VPGEVPEVPEVPGEATATAVAGVQATATAVAGVSLDMGKDAKSLLTHPGYQSQWGEPVYGGTLRMRTNVPARAGTAFSSSGNSHYELPAYSMKDSLVEVDPWLGWEGGIQPDLATSWEISEDGLTYTFQLRQGVFYRSATEWDKLDPPGRGEELTCEDVQSHMEFIGSDRWWDEGGRLGVYIDTLEHTWTCPDGANGFAVKVTIDTGIPNPGILMQLALPAVHGITNKEWLEWYTETYPPRWISTGEFTAHVGTGPWLPVSLVPEVKNVMVPNPNFWKEGLPFLDKFEFHTIPDSATSFAAWATGKIDVMGHGSGSMYPEQVLQGLRDFPDKPIIGNHYFGARGLGMSTGRPPFDDPRVRKAVHLTMDRQEWLRLNRVGDSDLYSGVIGGMFNVQGLGLPYNPMGATMDEILSWPGFNPATKDADIAEANRLMDEVFGEGNRPGPITCLGRNDPLTIKQCLFNIEMLARHLGINATMEMTDPASISTRGCAYTMNANLKPSWDAIPDPYQRYRRYNSDLPGALPCQDGMDPALKTRMNGLIADMQLELDFTKRSVISKEIEFILYNEYIEVAPFGWQVLFHGTQPWLRGWFAHHHAIHTGHISTWERTWTVR